MKNCFICYENLLLAYNFAKYGNTPTTLLNMETFQIHPGHDFKAFYILEVVFPELIGKQTDISFTFMNGIILPKALIQC